MSVTLRSTIFGNPSVAQPNKTASSAVTWGEMATIVLPDLIALNQTGSGDVTGPASSTNLNLAVFSGTTGKLLADGGVPVASFVLADGTIAAATTQPQSFGTFGIKTNTITEATVGGGIEIGSHNAINVFVDQANSRVDFNVDLTVGIRMNGAVCYTGNFDPAAVTAIDVVNGLIMSVT